MIKLTDITVDSGPAWLTVTGISIDSINTDGTIETRVGTTFIDV